MLSIRNLFYILFISMLPLVELRGSVPIGISLNIPYWQVLIISIIGNLIPILPIMLMFKPVSKILIKFKWYQKLYNWLHNRTIKKGKDNIEKYGAFGLFLFTAIPLPTTGAWTAALLSVFFKIRIKFAFPAIAMGVITAGLIMTLLSKIIF